jgi:methionyl-tRNA formyltransferase
MRPVAGGVRDGLQAGELRVTDGELLVGAADGGALALLEVQMEGKARLPGGVFARDFQVRPGERLG